MSAGPETADVYACYGLRQQIVIVLFAVTLSF